MTIQKYVIYYCINLGVIYFISSGLCFAYYFMRSAMHLNSESDQCLCKYKLLL